MSSDPAREVEVIGAYLLGGKKPNTQSIFLYQEAIRIKRVTLNARDEKLMNFILRHPKFAGLVDSGLAFSDPKSGVRKKILFMSAILETQPEYTDLFLQKERSFIYNFYIFWVGCRAVMKAAAGRILLMFL
jgi:hypothetical protein